MFSGVIPFKFANYLADAAALISRKYFRQKLVIDSKEGNYPVTIADREVELRLRELIKAHYPEHGIIGEEFASSAEDADYCWVLDPIDGTVAFSSGKPTFTTLIALLYRGEPCLSIIDQPISNERFSAISGAGAYLNGQPIATSNEQNLALARLNATTPYMFVSELEQAKFELVRKQVRITSFGGDAYAYGLLAAGHIDVIMEADLQYYDVAALLPIITASGGIISDWEGRPLSKSFNGQCLASANQVLHEQILALLN